MRIRAIASALPERKVTASEVAEWVGIDPAFIRDKVGVETKYFLGPDESGLDLAVKACENLFARTQLSPGRIKLVVYVTQNPDFRLPHNAALLQERLGLETDCAAFDLNLGCSGYVYALSVAKGFMAGEGISDALIITCDPYSKIMDRTDKSTVTVFGDGATATWMSDQEGAKIGRGDFGTDGSRSNALIVTSGGAADPLLSIHDTKTKTFGNDQVRLRMNGRLVFDFVVREVPKSIERCLNKNHIDAARVSFYVLHQGSRYMLEKLISEAGLSKEKVIINIDKVGNTVSSSVPMLLEEKLPEILARKGLNVVVSGFGVGLSWATNIIYN
jgi:3-oxoacyl-[acyl-carrier-protein] synthase-3